MFTIFTLILFVLIFVVSLQWRVAVHTLKSRDSDVLEYRQALGILSSHIDALYAQHAAVVSELHEVYGEHIEDLERRYLLAIDRIESLAYALATVHHRRLESLQVEFLINLYLEDDITADSVCRDLWQAIHGIHPGLFNWDTVFNRYARVGGTEHTTEYTLTN